VANLHQTSSGGGWCPHGIEQSFFGNDDIPVSWFSGGKKGSFSDDFSEFVFYNGEGGLSRSRGRHFGFLFVEQIFLAE
jgi:hypothetical protein